MIKRGKVLTPVEFGHQVFLAESVQGLITQYEVLEGNPGDDQLVEPSLEPKNPGLSTRQKSGEDLRDNPNT